MIPDHIFSQIKLSVAHVRPEVEVVFVTVPEYVPEQSTFVGRVCVVLTHRGCDDKTADWESMRMDPMPLSRIAWLMKKIGSPPRDGATLLDVGCGTGDLMIAMQQLGWVCCGFDASPHNISIATSSGASAILTQFGKWDWSKMFEVVTCVAVLEHLPRSEHHIIRDMRDCTDRLCVVADTKTVSSLHTQIDLIGILGDPTVREECPEWPDSYEYFEWRKQ